MDIFLHSVVPMALWALLRRPRAEVLAVGLGAAMPDMDVFLTWATRLDDGLYFMVHRGVSHSLLGSAFAALAGLAVLSRPWWARRWPRMAAFRWTAPTVLAAVAGAWTHLFLDGLTITGVPLLWPFSVERVAAHLYFYSALYTTPIGAWVIYRLARGTMTDRVLQRGGAVLVVLVVLAGGVRLATQPIPGPGEVVRPTPLETQWVVASPDGSGGWVVRDAGWVLTHRPRDTALQGNATPEAAGAVAAARRLGAYTAWAWQRSTPVVNATPLGPDAWRLEFRDALEAHRNATGGFWAGSFRTVEPLVVEVHGGQARLVARPGGWGFG